MRRAVRVAIKSLAWLAGLALLVLIISVVVFFHRIPGAKDSPAVFECRRELAIAKTGPGGVSYTVNNSTATFDLDVAPADEHCARLFPDYAAALRYCREHGLPELPSVQLFQGKCKQFDDRLCAALEAALQEGLPGDGRLGKRAALGRLLERLSAALAAAPEAHRPAVRKAVRHVAAALILGGGEPRLDAELTAEARREADDFLGTPAAKPVGFWSQSEALSGSFRQDRFLSGGFRLQGDLLACTVLAAAVAADPQLAEAFNRFREFSSKITGAPVFVDQLEVAAPPARCVSCAELAALLPSGSGPTEPLAPEALAGVRAAVARQFGGRSGFALVCYSQSKEYSLLVEAATNGEWTGQGDESAMACIVAAVRSGRLRLEPRPDSGWYDYQWHALETLLLPERAPEALKLHLSAAYRERLENAFRTSLTKCRETHIKRLPVITMMSYLPPPVKVDVAPEFCIEPTAAVYLRSARAYRFLRNSMRGVLGEEVLGRLRLDGGVDSPGLDDELRRMALLCYGVHDRLCLELGRPPDYLEDELAGEELTAAREAAVIWLAGLAEDPDLAADTRVAVPVSTSTWLDGPVRYWATGGVRLERAQYSYRDQPRVLGEIDPTFVPALRYLPTDVFLEFETLGPEPINRQEFRSLCDGYHDEESLRAALGAAPARHAGTRFPWRTTAWCVAAAALTLAGWLWRRRLAALWARRPRRLLLKSARLAAAALAAFVLALVLLPGLRTRFLVKWVAPVNVPAGLVVENWFVTRASVLSADHLADLLADNDPQTRYLAARFLTATEMGLGRDSLAAICAIPGMKERLQNAACDEIPEVAGAAMWLLGGSRDEDNTDFLLDRLEAVRRADMLCVGALTGLRETRSPRAIDAVLPFTHDRRNLVRREAICALSACPAETAVLRLAEVVGSGNEGDSESALYAIDALLRRDPNVGRVLDPALLEATRVESYSPDQRIDLAGEIKDPAVQVQAWLAIFAKPSSSDYTSIEELRQEAAEALDRLCPGRGITVERLAELTAGADVDLAKVAAELLGKQDARPEQ